MGSLSSPKAKASTATPAFNGVSNFDLGIGGLGRSRTNQQNGSIVTDSSLGEGFDSALSGIGSGLSNVTDYFQTPIDQRLAQLDAGQNDYYNALKLGADRDFENTLGRTYGDLSRRGLGGSSIMGGKLAQVSADHVFNNLRNKLAASEYLDNNALQSLQALAGAGTSLGGLAQQQAALSNRNLFDAYALNDATNRSNAANLTQASISNSQRPSALGGLLRGGLGLLGNVLLPGVGGSVLGGVFGSGAGGALGGVGSYSGSRIGGYL